MPVKKTVVIIEEAKYEIEVEVDEGLDDEGVESAALAEFLERDDPNAGFVAVLDRDVKVKK